MNSFVTDLKTTWNKPNNGLPRLIIINVIAFLAMSLLYFFCKISGFQEFYIEWIYHNVAIPAAISEFIFKPWTLFTYFFNHSLEDFFHIIFNMLGLYWFGSIFNEYLGNRKLVILYILGGIAGGIAFLLMYNLIPYYAGIKGAHMIGASASVYAIVLAAAVVAPEHRMNLLLFGPVKIKYLAAAYVFMSFIGTTGGNAGGNIAHLGGALMGFAYVRGLKGGFDMGKPVNATLEFLERLFQPKSKFKVSYRTATKKKKASAKDYKGGEPDQKIVDAILDKISDGGYESLSNEEKQILFKASQKKG